jgi:hypothetical protein
MKRSLRTILFLSVLLAPILSRAQTNILSNPKGLPIETHMDLGFLGVFGGPVEYSLGGRKLTSYREFKDLIYPLRDAEASDGIRVAEQMDFVSWVIYGGSIATGVDVALVFKPVPVFNDDALDRALTGLFVAQVGIGFWSLFNTSAEARKFNAVQRYNKLLRGKKVSEFQVDPLLYADGNGLNVGMKTAF